MKNLRRNVVIIAVILVTVAALIGDRWTESVAGNTIVVIVGWLVMQIRLSVLLGYLNTDA